MERFLSSLEGTVCKILSEPFLKIGMPEWPPECDQ